MKHYGAGRDFIVAGKALTEDIINLMKAEVKAIGWRFVFDQQFVLSR